LIPRLIHRTLCVTKDPDNKIPEQGTYRAATQSHDRLGVRMASG